ncbi:MAG: c-type cytochrome [Pseudomonadales bacterium]
MTTYRLQKALMATCCCLVAGSPTQAQAEAGIWDGVYTEQQATRGAVTYLEVCAGCHGEDMRGDSNSPSLVGMSFMFLWEERSLGELFASIRTAMPPTNPNSLPSDSYLDILAYIMQANNFPAGQDKLSAEPGKQDRILITGKP